MYYMGRVQTIFSINSVSLMYMYTLHKLPFISG